MASPEIAFEGVYKKFSKGQKFDSLREYVPAMVKRWARGIAGDELEDQEFWSVRDVSFHVRPGQVLGIIGHNGAGKSTILKLLTRILRPTRGSIRVNGRVGALIEVAAGFHPDLTGRENVYLQGSIMGMKRRDIQRRFDEIVAFSGIGDFIDTPTKRYSSGMNARLGFSIAAHLDPDVLIIDEVLAVGDAAFQQRAFERLGELANESRPVVVVSHQLDRILSLCTHALVMERGVAVAMGTPEEAVLAYTAGLGLVADSPGDAPARFVSVSVEPGGVAPGEAVTVAIRANVAPERRRVVSLGLEVRSSSSDKIVFATSSGRLGARLPDVDDVVAVFELQSNLGPGAYYIDAYAHDAERRTTYHGPRRVLTVSPTTVFHGGTFLEPRVTVRQATTDDAVSPA